MTMRSTCWPAFNEPEVATVAQFCQSPVFGTVFEPVTFAPFISMWKLPPLGDATLVLIVYEPALATFTVYPIHSPVSIHPTLKPPSEQLSMSTSVERYAPPRLPPDRSW